MLRLSTVAFVASLAGCATPLTTPAEGHEAVAAHARPAIVKLRLRDVDMTIESSSRGPLFAVVARDGAFIEHDLAAEDLAARHPELYQLYRSAVVRGPGAPYLDARLDRPAENDRTGGRLPR